MLWIALAMSGSWVNAQSTESLEGVAEVDSFLHHYYSVLSERDWQAFEQCFWKDATLTTVWQTSKDSVPKVFTNSITEFLAQTSQGPDSQPIFEESPTTIEVEVRGNLARAWVNYKAKFGSEADLLEWKGVDLFSLLRHDGEWRIVSVVYEND
ncbi:MAG: nuclear transport factor 2 family protein [Saprospiraceae bacterium]|nr:nuclear transport factor 2 family protein [Saprospiraceae bacterium]